MTNKTYSDSFDRFCNYDHQIAHAVNGCLSSIYFFTTSLHVCPNDCSYIFLANKAGCWFVTVFARLRSAFLILVYGDDTLVLGQSVLWASMCWRHLIVHRSYNRPTCSLFLYFWYRFIVWYLRICKAPLTELAIQRRSQRGCPEEIRMSSDNRRKRVAAQLGSYWELLGRPVHIERPYHGKGPVLGQCNSV